MFPGGEQGKASYILVYGAGTPESRNGNDCSTWEGQKGGTMCVGLDEGQGGKDWERCVSLMLERIWKSMTR